MSYHHVRGTIKHRVTNVMRSHLKFYYRGARSKFSNKPDVIFMQYCKTFGIPFETGKKYITDKCIEYFFDEKSKFYHAGSMGKGLVKILKYSKEQVLNEAEFYPEKKNKKTFRDMPDKVNGKYNYAKYRAYLNSPEWKLFRKEAIAHHGKVCNKCKRDELPVDVHHITYQRLYNELLIDVEILCRYCHKKEHKNRVRK